MDPKLGRERLIETWKVCCRMAADRGMEIVWEFEPGFAFNKPSEIVSIVDEMRDSGHSNFSILYDTCHAHMCAAIGHIHLIDSDGTLHDEETSTHNPFGKGCLDFDTLIPGILRCGCTSEWWTIDLCFWPNAWDVTEESIHFLNTMRDKYCG